MEVRRVPKEEREMRALALLKEVGLGDFADKYPKALSQGMRQRCALARTFALDSPVLLMDEPFGALDAQTKLTLEDVLLRLWSVHRKTVVFVTHDLGEAIALSDRVIVMSARRGARLPTCGSIWPARATCADCRPILASMSSMRACGGSSNKG
jgi:NitT/TauT family transport system ATP-binding protein